MMDRKGNSEMKKGDKVSVGTRIGWVLSIDFDGRIVVMMNDTGRTNRIQPAKVSKIGSDK